ncbi:serine carboxypeptidase s28 domain-containing protein [Ditylenchus destructor]|nr:serine carboxypeptidase s28 domain-containing protein [Ditylenchus destructor]
MHYLPLLAFLLLNISSIVANVRSFRLKDPILFQHSPQRQNTAHILNLADKGDNELLNLEQTPPKANYGIDYYPNMPIDHFGYTTANTFPLKYLYNMSYYKEGGPVFFYTGNEGAIELFAEATGIMFDLAPIFNAAIVFGEHRYYGANSSWPFGADSFKNVEKLNYLTTHQTLADYAMLIPYVKDKLKIKASAPVIAFGGSYGGMLAAWFRMKYPNIVTGSWAASAPLIQFRHGGIPLDASSAFIQRNFIKAGCKIEAILKGFDAIQRIAKADINKLNQIFKINETSQLTSQDDVSDITAYILEAYFYLAMTDYPYPTTFLKPLPAWPLEEACKFLSNVPQSDEELATQIQKSINVFYNSDSNCVKNTVCGDTATSALNVDVQWNFQYCTEIVIAQCSSGPPNDFFPPDCNATTFEQFTWDTCTSLIQSVGVDGFRKELVRFDAIEQLYGLSFEGASNIIFTNGDLDPWAAGGVTETTKGLENGPARGLYVYNISGGAHHLDLRQPNMCDPPSVVAARYQIVSILKCWAGLSPAEQCDGTVSLQQPLPAFVKMNEKYPKCESDTRGYPWSYGIVGNGVNGKHMPILFTWITTFVVLLSLL